MSGADKALREVLVALDGWIEGAKSNHEALGHWEADCCNTFHPEDIRSMVADAATSIKAEKVGKKLRKEKKLHPAQPPMPRRSSLLLEVETPVSTRQSFLIMSGDSLRIDLSGYEQNDKGGLRVVVVPVTITARIT